MTSKPLRKHVSSSSCDSEKSPQEESLSESLSITYMYPPPHMPSGGFKASQKAYQSKTFRKAITQRRSECLGEQMSQSVAV